MCCTIEAEKSLLSLSDFSPTEKLKFYLNFGFVQHLCSHSRWKVLTFSYALSWKTKMIFKDNFQYFLIIRLYFLLHTLKIQFFICCYTETKQESGFPSEEAFPLFNLLSLATFFWHISCVKSADYKVQSKAKRMNRWMVGGDMVSGTNPLVSSQDDMQLHTTWHCISVSASTTAGLLI